MTLTAVMIGNIRLISPVNRSASSYSVYMQGSVRASLAAGEKIFEKAF